MQSLRKWCATARPYLDGLHVGHLWLRRCKRVLVQVYCVVHRVCQPTARAMAGLWCHRLVPLSIENTDHAGPFESTCRLNRSAPADCSLVWVRRVKRAGREWQGKPHVSSATRASSMLPDAAPHRPSVPLVVRWPDSGVATLPAREPCCNLLPCAAGLPSAALPLPAGCQARCPPPLPLEGDRLGLLS